MDEKLICYRNDLLDNKDEILSLIEAKIRKGKKILYVLPTVQAIEKLKAYYIDKFEFIGNLSFTTFDGIKNTYSRGILKEGFRNFILKNLIRESNFKLINQDSKTVEIISSFYIKAKEENIGLERIKNTNKPLFAELYKLFSLYENFLQKNNLDDDFRLRKKVEDFDLLLVDGFFHLKNLEIEIIKSFNCEIIFNISYGISDINIEEDLVNKLKSIGFKIIDNRSNLKYGDFIEKNKEKLFLVEGRDKREELEKILSLIKIDLIEGKKADLISLDSNDTLSTMSDLKAIEISNIKKESSILIEEFINYLEYIKDKDRKNLIAFLKNKYFELENVNDRLINLIESISFKDYEDLCNKLRVNLMDNISSDDEDVLFELLKELDISLEEDLSFEDYSNYFLDILDGMDKKLYQFYEIHKRIDISRSDSKALRLLRLYLEEIKTYDKYFKGDFATFIKEIKNEFKNCRIKSIDYTDTNNFTIDESLYSIFGNLYIEGFNMDYPRIKSKDFIFNHNNEEDLLSFGFTKDEFRENYEEDLIRILSLIDRSDKLIFSSNDEDDYSIFNEDLKANKLEGHLITSKRDLALEILNDIREEKELKSIDDFKKNTNYKLIFKKIEEELKRDDSKDIIIQGSALNLINTIVKERGFWTSDFDAYTNWAYDFLYLRLLKLDEKIKENSIYKDLGIIYHKILEDYYKNLPLEYDSKILSEIIEKVVADYYVEEKNKDILELFKRIAHKELENFIKEDYSKGEISNLELEKYFEIEIDNNKISGRIDRIDKKEGSFILTDYKTGSIPTKSSVLENKSLQLPIYILSQKGKVGLARYADVREGNFKDIIINKDAGFKGAKSMSDDELEAFLDDCKNRIIEIIKNIKAGNFTVENVSEGLKDLRR